MSATAHVTHATRGRARLRLPSVKGDPPYFARVERVLRRCPAVTDVAVNASTGSVLVQHQGELGEIVAYAHAEDLFALADALPRGDALDGIRAALVRADASVRRSTSDSVNLRTFAFAGLLCGSAYQLFRGQFLPAGGAMLMYAVDILFTRRRAAE